MLAVETPTVDVRRFTSVILGLSLVVFLTSVASAAAAPSLAGYLASNTDRVELSNGYGLAAFHARGAIFGSIRRGTVRIVDLPRGADTTISVDGAERVRAVSDRITIYRGRRISFYVERGWWKVRIQGRDIDAGAAVHGSLALRGRSGTYTLRDRPARAWPSERRIFRLG